MKQAFKPYKIKPEYCVEDLFIGDVNYIDFEKERINDTILGVFFYKHLIFEAEKELRLSISLRTAEELGVEVPQQWIRVEVDYSVLIDNVIVGPNIDKEERERIQEIMKEKNLESKIINSTLRCKPIFF